MLPLISSYTSMPSGSLSEFDLNALNLTTGSGKSNFAVPTWVGRNRTSFRSNYTVHNKAGVFLSEDEARRQEISVQAQAKFVEIALSEYFESGYTPPSERYLQEFAKEYPGIVGNAVQTLILTHFPNSTVMVALLNAVGSIAYDSVRPYGQVTALAAVGHPSVEVKEAAIRAYETWGHIEGVGILRTLDCPWPWLDEYRNQVIQDLGAS